MILPAVPEQCSFLTLSHEMRPERFPCYCRQRNRTSAISRFGSAKATPFWRYLESTCDLRDSSVQVDILPAQCLQLALAHSSCKRNHNQRLEPISVYRLKQCTRLV